jgi:hypothetical protein
MKHDIQRVSTDTKLALRSSAMPQRFAGAVRGRRHLQGERSGSGLCRKLGGQTDPWET